MPRRRFFVPRENIRNGIAILPPEQAHHLRDVLRLGTDDEVELIDGLGTAYIGKVEFDRGEVQITSLQIVMSGQPVPTTLVLAPALIRSEKFTWVLQKATELGVNEIVPLVTRYCEARLPADRLENRLGRWQRIVREAAKQARRLSVPPVRTPIPFLEFLALKDDYAAYDRLLFYENSPDPWDHRCLQSSQTVLCIGPEGGWDSKEIAAAVEAGFKIFNLGPRILRAETATLAAVTLIQFAERAPTSP